MKKLFTAIFLLFILKSIVFAQPIPFSDTIRPTERMVFDRIDMEDGLSINVVTAILEDDRGFMWFGTADGLHRYDGYGCKIYRHVEEDSLSLPDNTIGFLHKGKEGVIWVGTNGGLSKFDPITEEFINYQHDEADSTSLADNHVLSIVTDSLGQLVIGTHNKGLEVFDPETEIFYHYPPNPNDTLGLVSMSIHKIKKDKDDNIWLGTLKEGIYYFDQGNKKIIRIGAYNDIYKNVVSINQYFDVFDVRLSGMNKKLDVKNKTWVNFVWNDEYVEWWQKYKPRIFEGPNLSRWTITEKVLAIENQTEKQIFSIANFPKNLNWSDYLTSFFDSKGNLWLGFSGEGVLRLSTQGRKFMPYLPKQHLLSFAPEKVIAISEDTAQNIWISILGDAIYKYQPQTESLKKYVVNYEVKLDPKSNYLTKIEEASLMDIDGFPDNDLWLAGIYTIYKYDWEKDTFLSKVIPEIDKPYYTSTTMVHKDKIGNIWFPTRNMGIVRYNPELNIFKVFSYDLKGANQADFSYTVSMIDDDYGNLWIGTKGGLTTFNPEKEKYYSPFIPNEGYEKIKGGNLSAPLLKDSKGNIWVSLLGKGLYRVNTIDRNYDFYDEKDGITANIAVSVLEDKGGNFWIWSGKNLIKLNPETRAFKKYGESDGLLVSNGWDISYQNSETGEMFFGLNSFFPEQIKDNPHPPKVVITWAEKYNNENQGQASGLTGIGYKDNLELSYNDNIINFEFSSLNFSNPAASEYQYQLKGLSDNWIQLGKKRNLTLTNLNPGQYDLNIKAANEDGYWAEVPTSLKIIVHPPWWKTWWAYVIYVVATIGSLIWYVQSLRKKINEKQAQLDRELALNNELVLLNEANQRFVPNDFLKILGKESIKDLALGDQKKLKMTVLFSDIRNYTPLSENMTPEENFKFINAYLGRVGPIINEHGGFISTYLGDGFMALFVDSPDNALKASIAMQKALNHYNKERAKNNRLALTTGMGLNTGNLMLGVIGDKVRYESTVISDAVNTASRMEGLTKIFGGAVIISERTFEGLKAKYQRIEEIPFGYRYLGKVKVKGKDKSLKIYDLYDGETATIRTLKATTKIAFESGISYYANQEFGKAADCFKQVLAVNENDLAAQYYLDKSVNYIINGVMEDWSGVEEMTVK
jgi:class 3 adenylate cyclase/ligand-binding sensor domain-containing protein